VPLKRSESGEPVGAFCLNGCGDLARLDQKVAFVVPGAKNPQAMTLLICPVCNYCEWYYGADDDEGTPGA
jgi:hypothetical protein